MNLSVQIGKLTLQNPVTVASVTFGYGIEYAQLLDLNQLGAVVVKGIRLGSLRTLQPQRSSAGLFFRTPQPIVPTRQQRL